MQWCLLIMDIFNILLFICLCEAVLVTTYIVIIWFDNRDVLVGMWYLSTNDHGRLKARSACVILAPSYQTDKVASLGRARNAHRCQTLTQYARLSLQQGQDVLVEKKRTEAEEVPQAEVSQRSGVPHARVGFDHGRLRYGDFQNLLVGYALAARQDHPLRTRPPERQKKLGEHGPFRSAVARHGAHSERGPYEEHPLFRTRREKSETTDLLHREGDGVARRMKEHVEGSSAGSRMFSVIKRKKKSATLSVQHEWGVFW